MRDIFIQLPARDIKQIMEIDQMGAKIHYKGKILIAYPDYAFPVAPPAPAPAQEVKPVDDEFTVRSGSLVINLKPLEVKVGVCEEPSLHAGARDETSLYRMGMKDRGATVWKRFVCRTCLPRLYEMCTKYGTTAIFFGKNGEVLI